MVTVPAAFTLQGAVRQFPASKNCPSFQISTRLSVPVQTNLEKLENLNMQFCQKKTPKKSILLIF